MLFEITTSPGSNTPKVLPPTFRAFLANACAEETIASPTSLLLCNTLAAFAANSGSINPLSSLVVLGPIGLSFIIKSGSLILDVLGTTFVGVSACN